MLLQRVMKKESGCLSSLIPGHLQFFRRVGSLTQYIKTASCIYFRKAWWCSACAPHICHFSVTFLHLNKPENAATHFMESRGSLCGRVLCTLKGSRFVAQRVWLKIPERTLEQMEQNIKEYLPINYKQKLGSSSRSSIVINNCFANCIRPFR